jgi:hypothetical protein
MWKKNRDLKRMVAICAERPTDILLTDWRTNKRWTHSTCTDICNPQSMWKLYGPQHRKESGWTEKNGSRELEDMNDINILIGYITF